MNSLSLSKKMIPALRILFGCLLAYSLYYLAEEYATMDCKEIQFQMRKSGVTSIISVVGVSVILSVWCVPISLIAIFSGIILGPGLAAPITSIGVIFASVIAFHLGKATRGREAVEGFLRRHIVDTSWFQFMMNERSPSGFHWCSKHSFLSPLPFAGFSFLIGIKVPHIKFRDLVVGIFAGSLLPIAAYSLAGSGIGCAIINHALAKPTRSFNLLVISSCLILYILTRYQHHLRTDQRTK